MTFKTGHVKVGTHTLKVELAVDDAERSHGLMFRKTMGKEEGMLFVFDEPGYHSMWMKDTLIPLSVAFIDGEGKIINILDMEPQTFDTHSAAGPARYRDRDQQGLVRREEGQARRQGHRASQAAGVAVLPGAALAAEPAPAITKPGTRDSIRKTSAHGTAPKKT